MSCSIWEPKATGEERSNGAKRKRRRSDARGEEGETHQGKRRESTQERNLKTKEERGKARTKPPPGHRGRGSVRHQIPLRKEGGDLIKDQDEP